MVVRSDNTNSLRIAPSAGVDVIQEPLSSGGLQPIAHSLYSASASGSGWDLDVGLR